jgi:hypothetical protein
MIILLKYFLESRIKICLTNSLKLLQVKIPIQQTVHHLEFWARSYGKIIEGSHRRWKNTCELRYKLTSDRKPIWSTLTKAKILIRKIQNTRPKKVLWSFRVSTPRPIRLLGRVSPDISRFGTKLRPVTWLGQVGLVGLFGSWIPTTPPRQAPQSLSGFSTAGNKFLSIACRA